VNNFISSTPNRSQNANMLLLLAQLWLTDSQYDRAKNKVQKALNGIYEKYPSGTARHK